MSNIGLGLFAIFVSALSLAGQTGPSTRPPYSLTFTLRLAKPFNLHDLNDDWQEARLIQEDGEYSTVEVKVHPLAPEGVAIGENPNWRTEYAGMREYLDPTPSENWDEKMRADLRVELKKAGIDPDVLTDRELVTRVSRWAKSRSRFTRPFTSFFVQFQDGRPMVPQPLRTAFDHEKPDPAVSDGAMFGNEVLGREMFYGRTHGACTSYAVYQATILRALGIPARIVICIPPADGNDPDQRQKLLTTVRQNQVRADIRHGLPRGGKGTQENFADHMFNEVYVGGRWVRLNYDRLGQGPLDPEYLGLMIHILTVRGLSDVPLAATWGMRYAHLVKNDPSMTSMNPYRLLDVSEFLPPGDPNPEVQEDLQAVHVTGATWRSAPPADVMPYRAFEGDQRSDFHLRIREWIPNYRNQLSDFLKIASHRFLLESEGHPPVHARYSGFTTRIEFPAFRVQMIGVAVDPADRGRLVPGTRYRLKAEGVGPICRWILDPPVELLFGGQEQLTPDPFSKVTVAEAYWREELPFPDAKAAMEEHDRRSDFFVRVTTCAGVTSKAFGEFCKQVSPVVLLHCSGNDDLKAVLTWSCFAPEKGRRDQSMIVGLKLQPESKGKWVPGTSYALSLDGDFKPWEVAPKVILKTPSRNSPI